MPAAVDALVVPEPAGTALPRLRSLGPAARMDALTDLVRTEAAAELGHAGVEAIAADRPFRDLGLDSLTAVGLRDRLASATGLRLTAALVYDHGTPAAVARHLAPLLDGDAAPDGTLGGVYRDLAERGLGEEMHRFGLGAAALRERFTGGETAKVVRLGGGPDGPHLIGLPPLTAFDHVLNFAQLARCFPGETSVVLPPGYAADERLAPSFAALADVLTAAVTACADGKPFALLGISAGGLLAHAVTVRLERQGLAPSGVVLLDSYLPGGLAPRLSRALVHGAAQAGAATYHDHAITAASAYTELLREWQPEELATPTLVLRPEDAVPLPPGEETLSLAERTSVWPLAHESARVPGDHFTMSTEHAAETAEVVLHWLDTVGGLEGRP